MVFYAVFIIIFFLFLFNHFTKQTYSVINHFLCLFVLMNNHNQFFSISSGNERNHAMKLRSVIWLEKLKECEKATKRSGVAENNLDCVEKT